MHTITPPALILATDESTGVQNTLAGTLQVNDYDPFAAGAIPLPTRFTQALTAAGASAASGTTIALSGVSQNDSTPDNVAGLTFTAADKVTDVAFTNASGAPLVAVNSGLTTTDGTTIYLYTSTVDNNVVIGSKGLITDPNSPPPVVFAAFLDTGVLTGPGDAGTLGAKLWVAQFQSIFHDDPTNPNDIEYLMGVLNATVTRPQEFPLEGAPSGQNLFLMFGDGTPSTTETTIVVTGRTPANQSTGASITTGDTVNTGQGGGTTTIGSNNQMIDPNEGMYFTFVSGANPDYTVKNLDQTEADVEAHIDFTSLVGVNGASFAVVQLQPPKGATLFVSALNASMDNNGTPADTSDDLPWSGVNFVDHLNQNTEVNIDSVTITRTGKNGVAQAPLVFKEGGTTSDKGSGLSLDFSSNGVTIAGVVANDVIEYHTAQQHDRLLVTNSGDPNASKLNSAFDIGKFQLIQGVTNTVPLDAVAFLDDGPAATTTKVAATMDEDGLTGGNPAGPGDFEPTLTSTVSGSIAGLFTIGADGLKSYSLSTDTSGLTALKLSSQGGTVAYDVTSNVLTAFVDSGPAGLDPGDSKVFTLSLDNPTKDGSATFTLLGTLDHPATDDPGTLNVTETSFEDDLAIDLSSILRVTDGDGDTATAAAKALVITVDDDSPTTTAATFGATVDEDGLTGGNAAGAGDFDPTQIEVSGKISAFFSPGADGLKSYSLATDTSALAALNLKSHGGTVSYDVTNNKLTAYVDTGTKGLDSGDSQVFTLALTDPSDGSATFKLLGTLDHPGTDDPDVTGTQTSYEDDIAIDLSSILQVTDKDGDTVKAATKALVISVDDDSPVGFTPTSITLTNTGKDSGTKALNSDTVAGADGLGTLVFVDPTGAAVKDYLVNTKDSTVLKSGGENIVLSFAGTTLTAARETTGDTVFVATIDTSATDQYTITFSRTIDDGGGISFLGAAPVKSGNPTYNLIDNVSKSNLDLLFSGGDTSGGVPTLHSVNVSTQGAGTDNQSMNPGETLRIDFANGASLAGSPAGSDFVMGTHQTVNGYSLLVSQNTNSGTTGTLFIQAFDADDDKILVGDLGTGKAGTNTTPDTLDTITKVVVSGLTLVENGALVTNGAVKNGAATINGNTVQATLYQQGVVLTGLNEGATGDAAGGDDPVVKVYTGNGFNRVEMSNYSGMSLDGGQTKLGGTSFDIAPAGVDLATQGTAFAFQLPVQMTDYDGDTGPLELIGVTVNPVAI